MLHDTLMRSGKHYFMVDFYVTLALWDLYSHCCCCIGYNIKANRVSVKSKRKAVSRSVGDTLRQYYTAMPFDAFGSRAIQCCSSLTLQVRGEDDTLSSNTLCLVCNLFALRLHLFLFETFALLRISRLHSVTASGYLCLSMLSTPLWNLRTLRSS